MTTTTQQVSKETARAISEELTEAAKAILAKYGLETEKISTNFGDWYKFSIEASAVTLGRNGVNLSSKDAQEWLINAFQFGYIGEIAQAMLGKQFTQQGKTYTFIGCQARRTKNPMVCKCDDGKQYLFAETILSKLA